VRSWRIIGSEKSGFYCYFDPRREAVEIRELTLCERIGNLSMLSVSAPDGDGEQLEMFGSKSLPEGVPFGI